MAPFVGLIKDLQPGKSKYTLRLRLIRSYKIPQIQNPDEVYSHEMVLHDHEGNKIHGSIEKASIPAFQDKLHKGNVYLMMNFIVAPNMMRTKTTTCPYKIILFKQTRMSEILDDSFPSYLLNLKSFDEIVSLEQKLDTPLFDIHVTESSFNSGVPNHEVYLKVGTPVMLLRNIDHASGLCNGTRLMITRLGNHVLEAKILTGESANQKVLIPRMSLTPTDTRLPFKFELRQFPLIVSYAMTINKSQGQTLSHVGLFCQNQFSHMGSCMLLYQEFGVVVD